jgi:hypothetical protein
MRRFVIEYWFRDSWFEKHNEEIIIIALSEKLALQTLHNIIKKRIIAPKIISESLINN